MAKVELTAEQRRTLEEKRRQLHERLRDANAPASDAMGLPKRKVKLTPEQRRTLDEKRALLHQLLHESDPLVQLAKRRREHEREVAARRAEALRRQNEARAATTLRIVDGLISLHEQTLLRKRRLSIHHDDYGRAIDHLWRRELDYFIRNVVLEEIDRREMHQEKRWLDSGGYEYLARYISDALPNVSQDSAENVAGMAAHEYEDFCVDELMSAGWQARKTAATGDQGVDIVATRNGATVAFQCKLYGRPLGNKAVQEVYTGMALYRAHYAAVISNADFTPGARVAAAQTGVRLLHHSQLRTYAPEARQQNEAT